MNNLINKAVILAWITILYNVIEGIISIFFGTSESSVALAGFGFDSLIEVTSGIVVLWRFTGETQQAYQANSPKEKIAVKSIGFLFMLLAAVLSITSIYQLITHSHPETTLPGIVISLLSLATMFFLYNSKKAIGTKLNSPTVLKDAGCTMACIKLSLVLFIGSLVYWVQPSLWWSDSVASILLAYFIYKEGRCTLKQSGVACGSCDCQ